MSELKPCPFCGVEPEVLSDMGCTWGLVKHRDGCFFPNFRHQQIPEYEFEAWNTRDGEACRAELANRYIELPLDADGVPIHIGDVLNSDEYRGRQFPCRGMSVDVHGGKHWTVCMDYDSYSGTSEWCAASRCHHVR